MLRIVNNMEAQHVIAASDDVKPQKPVKATKDEDNEEDLLNNILTGVMIYNKPNITNDVQLDKHETKKTNINLENHKKGKAGEKNRWPNSDSPGSATTMG